MEDEPRDETITRGGCSFYPMETSKIKYRYGAQEFSELQMPKNLYTQGDGFRFVRIKKPLVSSFPYEQSFEGGLDDWRNVTFYKWMGDDDDSYAYVGGIGTQTLPENADEDDFNRHAIIEGPVFDLSTMTSPVLSFWYRMDDDDGDMGDLKVQISEGGGYRGAILPSPGSSEAPEYKGLYETQLILYGDQGDEWLQASIDLSSYVDLSGFISVRFHALAEDGETIDDIAIDYIEITDPPTSYDFTDSDSDHGAEAWDMDDFPFGFHLLYLNSRTSITDTDSIKYSDNDYTVIDPGLLGQDIAGFYAEMDVSDMDTTTISKIVFHFEGHSDETNTFKLYVKKSGYTVYNDNAWVLLAEKEIDSGVVDDEGNIVDNIVRGTIYADFDDYITYDDKIAWLVVTPDGAADDMYVDYAKMDVYPLILNEN